MNKKNDFDFDFAEKSTRKAVIFGAIFGFISAIFAWNDAFGRLYDLDIFFNQRDKSLPRAAASAL